MRDGAGRGERFVGWFVGLLLGVGAGVALWVLFDGGGSWMTKDLQVYASDSALGPRLPRRAWAMFAGTFTAGSCGSLPFFRCAG